MLGLFGVVRVVAGDIESDGFLSWLKVTATDLFYREDHDLVVNTQAMYGGSPRINAGRFYFESGADVSHFNYFKN